MYNVSCSGLNGDHQRIYSNTVTETISLDSSLLVPTLSTTAKQMLSTESTSLTPETTAVATLATIAIATSMTDNNHHG